MLFKVFLAFCVLSFCLAEDVSPTPDSKHQTAKEENEVNQRPMMKYLLAQESDIVKEKATDKVKVQVENTVVKTAEPVKPVEQKPETSDEKKEEIKIETTAQDDKNILVQHIQGTNDDHKKTSHVELESFFSRILHFLGLPPAIIYKAFGEAYPGLSMKKDLASSQPHPSHLISPAPHSASTDHSKHSFFNVPANPKHSPSQQPETHFINPESAIYVIHRCDNSLMATQHEQHRAEAVKNFLMQTDSKPSTTHPNMVQHHDEATHQHMKQQQAQAIHQHMMQQHAEATHQHMMQQQAQAIHQHMMQQQAQAIQQNMMQQQHAEATHQHMMQQQAQAIQQNMMQQYAEAMQQNMMQQQAQAIHQKMMQQQAQAIQQNMMQQQAQAIHQNMLQQQAQAIHQHMLQQQAQAVHQNMMQQQAQAMHQNTIHPQPQPTYCPYLNMLLQHQSQQPPTQSPMQHPMMVQYHPQMSASTPYNHMMTQQHNYQHMMMNSPAMQQSHSQHHHAGELCQCPGCGGYFISSGSPFEVCPHCGLMQSHPRNHM